MNLLRHLLLRIVAVAGLCLLATTAYVLIQTDQTARRTSQRIAESLGKQLNFQQIQKDAGFNAAPFPDFSLWKQTNATPGICIHFAGTVTSSTHRLCIGTATTNESVPSGFAELYRRIFNPGLAYAQTLDFKGQEYAILTITPSAEMEITQAWENVRRLVGLSVMTVFAVCGLVYLSLRRALRPAQTLVAGVGYLQQGELTYRLPAFELREWQQLAEAINQLAASQQLLLTERQTLALQLMDVQEEERRYLARELHDELGQCLTAINAINSAITQTATQHCPELLTDTAQISQITEHMLANVRGLLTRLRPAEFDQLGLAASLEGLIGNWNAHSGNKTKYLLKINGDSRLLPQSLALNLFRIAQECLTNIAKHAAAKRALVILVVSHTEITLTIEDNGMTRQLPFPQHTGIGLLGIRERVTALHGQLNLATLHPQGLQVRVYLPIRLSAKAQL
jgi:signal transduction histidine kinase